MMKTLRGLLPALFLCLAIALPALAQTTPAAPDATNPPAGYPAAAGASVPDQNPASATPAPTPAAEPKVDTGDTAWMLSSTALVLMMTIPGVALFYGGMVRKKNVLATMAQSLAATGICSLLWFAAAYSLTFSGDGPAIGSDGHRPRRARERGDC